MRIFVKLFANFHRSNLANDIKRRGILRGQEDYNRLVYLSKSNEARVIYFYLIYFLENLLFYFLLRISRNA